MRCGSPAYSAAVPATVSEEPRAEKPLGISREGGQGDDPRARRPAVKSNSSKSAQRFCVRNCENSNSEKMSTAEIFPDEISDRLAGVPGKERVFEGR